MAAATRARTKAPPGRERDDGRGATRPTVSDSQRSSSSRNRTCRPAGEDTCQCPQPTFVAGLLAAEVPLEQLADLALRAGKGHPVTIRWRGCLVVLATQEALDRLHDERELIGWDPDAIIARPDGVCFVFILIGAESIEDAGIRVVLP